MLVQIVSDDADYRIHLIDTLKGFESDDFRFEFIASDMLSYETDTETCLILLDADGPDAAAAVRLASGQISPLIVLAPSGCDWPALLNSGTDYVLPREPAGRELLACVRAAVRRCPELGSRSTYGDVTLDAARMMLLCSSGRSVKLGFYPCRLLRCLMADGGRRYADKEELLRRAWGDLDRTQNVVEVTVTGLRRRLTELGSDVKILAERRIGYRLEYRPS